MLQAWVWQRQERSVASFQSSIRGTDDRASALPVSCAELVVQVPPFRMYAQSRWRFEGESDAKTHRTPKALRAISRKAPVLFAPAFGVRTACPPVCGRPRVASS